LNTKHNFWIRVIGSSVFFAAVMMFTSNTHHSWQQRIVSFFTLATAYGAGMYWVEYRKSKPKTIRHKNVF
jgi:hypothetical protein